MTINDQIRDEKLQYDINRKPDEISALSSVKIDKYEHLTGKETWPSNQQQIIEQDKFTYAPLGKAFEKQIKVIEDQGETQVEVLKDLKDLNLKDHQKQPSNDYEDKVLISKERDKARLTCSYKHFISSFLGSLRVVLAYSTGFHFFWY